MASKRSSLQLQFTVQGGKRVLPLTMENVVCVFQTGVLTTKGHSVYTFGRWLGIPDEHCTDPVSAAAWWVREGRDRRWRVIIYWLDEVGEVELAEELMPYSESPSDPSLTAAGVLPIFIELEKWSSTKYFTCGAFVIVPERRADIIRQQCSSRDEQKKKAAIYYETCHPFADWGHLAGSLYQAGEKGAIEAFKVHLPKSKDPTLTIETVMTATQNVEMSESGSYLDMPHDVYRAIIERNGTGQSGREAIFSEFLSQHPYPTWERVIHLLQYLERKKKARAGLADEVKEKYLTMDDYSEDEISCEKEPALPKKNISHEIDINDLQFGKLLGTGGFGTVFQGKWKSKDIDVALKSVRITPDASDANVMKELGDHPNIISFYGFAYRHPETIIVTALAKKGSLYNYLHIRKKKPTEQQSLLWAKQIAYGVAFMHRLDYVHRDLKSSNVLFSDDMVAQVCDFGTARFLQATTIASKTAGTGRWMAPEVANDDAINKQCDVFSFSLVVWELMEHKIPYPEDRTEVKASMSIISGVRPPISHKWPDYLSSLTKACWAGSPKDRPTFRDIVASLENKIFFRR